jgi:hypothetical protein
MNVLIDSDDLDETPAQHDGMGKAHLRWYFNRLTSSAFGGLGLQF